ncbi:putative nuclease HARBI1 [Heterodontus francisci]|uniref:putative nuclease HARBI1 n=1 Tax=Heterodontus francisci TaxID=7792 RepID=UPI00355B27F8
MPVVLKVTAALNYFANGSSQGSTGNICGISQSATHRCIKEVTNALFRCANDFIYLPVDVDSWTTRSAAFGTIARFPRGQGVIDCTHVAIRAPWDQPTAFVDHKGFHSLNIQLVCDHKRRIMHFLWPYNVAHASIRAIMEHTISMLKMRFRCIDRSGGALQYAPQRVSQIIIVCCAVHYLAIRCGNILQAEEQEEHQSSSGEDDYEEGEEKDNSANDAVIDMRAMEKYARDIRDNLIYTYFSQQ